MKLVYTIGLVLLLLLATPCVVAVDIAPNFDPNDPTNPDFDPKVAWKEDGYYMIAAHNGIIGANRWIEINGIKIEGEPSILIQVPNSLRELDISFGAVTAVTRTAHVKLSPNFNDIWILDCWGSTKWSDLNGGILESNKYSYISGSYLEATATKPYHHTFITNDNTTVEFYYNCKNGYPYYTYKVPTVQK
jgi:hypothetical protein